MGLGWRDWLEGATEATFLFLNCGFSGHQPGEDGYCSLPLLEWRGATSALHFLMANDNLHLIKKPGSHPWGVSLHYAAESDTKTWKQKESSTTVRQRSKAWEETWAYEGGNVLGMQEHRACTQTSPTLKHSPSSRIGHIRGSGRRSCQGQRKHLIVLGNNKINTARDSRSIKQPQMKSNHAEAEQ